VTQHLELKHGQILHEGFTAPMQELNSAAAVNFRLSVVNSTTIKVAAGTGNDQVGLAIEGQYRWRSTETTATLPGGLSNGEHPVYVTASANDFSGPIATPDNTVHTFGLQVRKSGEPPTTDLYRLVGYVTIASNAITALRQVVGSVSGAQIENGSLSNSGDLEWTREQSGAWVPQLKADSVGSNEIAAGAVNASEVNDALKPSKGAAAGTEALRALGTSSSTAAAGDDARLSDTRTPTDNTVSTAKLQDGAATSPKIKPSSGSVAGNETGSIDRVALTGSYAAIPNCVVKITPSVNSVMHFWAVFSVRPKSGKASNFFGKLEVDGEEFGKGRQANYTSTAPALSQLSIPAFFHVPLTGGVEHTIKMIAKDIGSGQETEIEKALTYGTWMLFAA